MINIDHYKVITILNGAFNHLIQEHVSFNVLYWGITPSHKNNPIHRHSFFEMCYVLDGKGNYHDRYMDQQYDHSLEKGTLFFSRPGAIHQIRSQTGLYLLFVAFEIDEANTSTEYISKFQSLQISNHFFRPNAEQSPSALLWQSLIMQFEQPAVLNASLIRSTAYSLLLSFLTEFSENGNDEKFPGIGRGSKKLLKQATTFIRDNLWQSLPLGLVASYLHISDRHLSRLFTQAFGLTYTEYLYRERIRLATNFLQNTNMPIKEVAEEVGYSSVHYFTNVFTKATGLPPGKFRAELGKEKNAPIVISSDQPAYETPSSERLLSE